MADKHRRRRRGQGREEITLNETPVEVDNSPATPSTEPEAAAIFMQAPPDKAVATNPINEIRSELFDSDRASDVESDYSDDTHNWLDGESAEYAHFLGSFE